MDETETPPSQMTYIAMLLTHERMLTKDGMSLYQYKEGGTVHLLLGTFGRGTLLVPQLRVAVEVHAGDCVIGRSAMIWCPTRGC